MMRLCNSVPAVSRMVTKCVMERRKADTSIMKIPRDLCISCWTQTAITAGHPKEAEKPVPCFWYQTSAGGQGAITEMCIIIHLNLLCIRAVWRRRGAKHL